jgi:GTP-binding protein
MIADVGLLGFPSVGKSSLLARVSSARPKIAAYHFTTLSPNLGVVSVGEGKGFVMADIPGLVEGAADGVGLGHAFLRHVDRCRLLLHIVDIAATEGRDPVEDVVSLDTELLKYSPDLADRPQILVGNKIDAMDPESSAVEELRAFAERTGREVYFISTVTGEGVKELIARVKERLETLPAITVYEPELTPEDEAVAEADVTATTVRRENNTFYVEGQWLLNFMGQINFDDYESLNFFQRVLTKNGVFDLLREKGVKDGDTVNIYDFEFDFVK